MKGTPLTNAVDEVIALKMRAADEVIRTKIKTLLDSMGTNPEKWVGSPWPWTGEVQMQIEQLAQNPILRKIIEDFIAKKAIAQMHDLETEVM